MNFQNYKELLISSLSQTYKIDSFYLGEEYDIAGTFSKMMTALSKKKRAWFPFAMMKILFCLSFKNCLK